MRSGQPPDAPLSCRERLCGSRYNRYPELLGPSIFFISPLRAAKVSKKKSRFRVDFFLLLECTFLLTLITVVPFFPRDDLSFARIK